MENKLSPQEILEIAEKVEMHGQNLYESLEAKTEDEKLKTVWKFLKEQEIVHRKVFHDMLQKDESFKVHEFGTGEYDAYIEAIASEYIFTPQLIEDKLNSEFASDLQAVDFALSIEKEAVLVYSALKKYIKEDKQKLLDKIIEEEKKHIIQLIKLKQILRQ